LVPLDVIVRLSCRKCHLLCSKLPTMVDTSDWRV